MVAPVAEDAYLTASSILSKRYFFGREALKCSCMRAFFSLRSVGVVVPYVSYKCVSIFSVVTFL